MRSARRSTASKKCRQRRRRNQSDALDFALTHPRPRRIDKCTYLTDGTEGYELTATFYPAALVGPHPAPYASVDKLPRNPKDAIYDWSSLEDVRKELIEDEEVERFLRPAKLDTRAQRALRRAQAGDRKVAKRRRKKGLRPAAEGHESDDAPDEGEDHPKPPRPVRSESTVKKSSLYVREIIAEATDVVSDEVRYLAEIVVGDGVNREWFTREELSPELVRKFLQKKIRYAQKSHGGSRACSEGARLVYVKDADDNEEGKKTEDRETCAPNLKEDQRGETRHTTAGILLNVYSCGIILHMSEMQGAESLSQL
jgi:hypothetical protein